MMNRNYESELVIVKHKRKGRHAVMAGVTGNLHGFDDG